MNLAALRHRIVLKRGSDLLRKGQWEKACSVLGRAARLAPTHWESHNNLAIAFLKLGRWEEAAGMAQRAIRLAPTAADSHDVFGIALLQLERWEEAVVAYRRAITVDPARYDSYDRLGMALWRLERWDEVVRTYETALKLDASHYTAHQRVGIASLQLARWEPAAAALRRAVELAENDPVAGGELDGFREALATALARVEAAKTGKPVARPAHPGTAKHLERGVELLALQRWEEAAAELAKGSKLSPHLGGLHFFQVDPLMKVGRVRDAVAAHHRAVAAGGELPGLPASPAAARFAQREAAFWSAENLDADVFAMERWLNQLSVVPVHGTSGPRLLFVLDNDFGELTTLKYFVLGQELAGRSTLLLSERLYAHNADAIPGRTRRYASVDDILQTVDTEHAEIVFLCSGYLLWQHLAFTPADLTRLIDQLRERGCRVVTADPFLGKLSQEDPRSMLRVDIPTEHLVWTEDQLTKAKRAAEEGLQSGFGESERILRDTYHLYPSFCDVAEGDVSETDARNLSFFNDRILRPARTTPGTSDRHWLFILGNADCDIQALFEGDVFLDILACKLVETRAAGRHPILIAPREFLDKFMPRMPTTEGIDILSHTSFPRFMSLLLSAEHVFYWNVVSHSLLIRLYNGLPIVQFDFGHLLRIAPTIRDRIVRWYYQGFAPPIRNHREPLTLETVEGWAAEYRQQAAQLMERYRRAPSPDEMIADLARRPVVPSLSTKVGIVEHRESTSRGEIR